MTDQQTALERQRALYREKNAHLDQFLEPVEPYEFYREIFPKGSFERKGHYEDAKGNAIALTVPKKQDSQENGVALEIEGDGKTRRHLITDELEELGEIQNTDFTIMSPISYFGRQRSGKNARYLYALVFDLDGVYMPQLRDTLHQMNKDIIPKATFIVNSGTGLHLYYVLTEPVPMYPHNQKILKELKYSLTRQIWNRFTSSIKEPQMQGVLQGFRVVGSGSKLGRDYPVVAYRFGGAVELEKLLDYIPASNGERQHLQALMKKSRLSLAEAREKYPDWYERRIVKKERRGRWTVKRDLYDWWLRRIADEIKVYRVRCKEEFQMNKKELVAAVAEQAGLKKVDAEKAIEAFTAVVEGALKAGDKVQLVGFGTFEVAERPEREGRNPRSGETMTIAASKNPKFKAGKALKDAINA